jgi:hypothetical protein
MYLQIGNHSDRNANSIGMDSDYIMSLIGMQYDFQEKFRLSPFSSSLYIDVIGVKVPVQRPLCLKRQ